MANINKPKNDNIDNLIREFVNVNVQDEDYTNEVDKILKILTDLRTDEITTMMPAHKLVEWNKYVTGLEHLIRSGSENSNEINTTSKESIDKHSDDVNTTMDFLETDIVQKTLSESDNTLPDLDQKPEIDPPFVTTFQPLSQKARYKFERSFTRISYEESESDE